MENYRIDAIGLLLALIAITLLLSGSQTSFGFLSSLSGLTILLVISAFDRRYRSGVQSLAFAAVASASCLLIDGYLLQLLAEPKLDRAGFDKWLSIIWLVEAVIFWSIDRARMGSREQATVGAPLSVARTTGQGFIAQSAPAPVYVPPAPAPAPTYVPPAPVAPAPPPPPPVYREPEPPAPVYVPPPPPPPTPVEPIPLPVTPPAPPPVHVIPPGKEVMIYVNLMGEAMNMLRAVRAENLGRDFYLIADEMPEGEDWEFKPGQIVKCKKKNLSSGKGLVAFEEAPRAK